MKTLILGTLRWNLFGRRITERIWSLTKPDKSEHLLGSLAEGHGRTSGAKGLANDEVGGTGHSTMSPLCCGSAWSRLETLRRSVSLYFQLSRFQFSLSVFSVLAIAVSLYFSRSNFKSCVCTFYVRVGFIYSWDLVHVWVCVWSFLGQSGVDRHCF